MYIDAETSNQSIFFNFKSPLLYIWCIYVAIFFTYVFFLLLQVENLNLVTNLESYYFYALLITCKSTPLCKKLDYDVKNEPPHLATTHGVHIQKNNMLMTTHQDKKVCICCYPKRTYKISEMKKVFIHSCSIKIDLSR